MLVIAEIGNNHEGDFDRAAEMVRQAAATGADAVKFQTFRTEHYVSRSDGARFARLKSFEFSLDQFEALSVLARQLGMLFVSTPFDLASARGLRPMVDAFKVSSGDLLFFPLLSEIAASGKPVILSSGGSCMQHVAEAIEYVRSTQERKGAVDVGLLHCVSSYPTPPGEANLGAIPALAARFDVAVGYSDHTLGIEAAIASVALGARIVEKHFTLDKEFSDFRDHQLSADPDEFGELVRRCRLVQSMIGTGEKRPQPCEEAGLPAMRRSIVCARDLTAGHRLNREDLTWVRPAGGLAPGKENLLIGKVLRRPLAAGERLAVQDVL
ncbi:MAG: N-acetylneuraminate synthase family protein [Vicinamibacterales bacterium]